MLYHHKNLTSCSSKQPGAPCSRMSINYIKQSKSPLYVVRGSSEVPSSISLRKGGLLRCSRSSRGHRSFYTYQDKVGDARHRQQVWGMEPWTCWEVELRGRQSEKENATRLGLIFHYISAEQVSLAECIFLVPQHVV